MIDTHVHSTFSHDGKSTIEDYSQAADRDRAGWIGFAEHYDFLPEATGYGKFAYNDYRKCIDKFREKGYKFFAGAEVGYAPHIEESIREGLKDRQLDFITGAVHRVDGLPLSGRRFGDMIESSRQFHEIIEKYHALVSKSLKFKILDVIAHIGIYKRYLGENVLTSDGTDVLIGRLEKELALECAGSDKIIEVNTSGLFSTIASTLPGADFLKAYYGNGGRMVSIGSDAHNTGSLARGFGQALAMLEEIGLKYVYLPWDRENPLKIADYKSLIL